MPGGANGVSTGSSSSGMGIGIGGGMFARLLNGAGGAAAEGTPTGPRLVARTMTRSNIDAPGISTARFATT